MRHLLDTNIVSQVIRGDEPRVRQRLAALPMGEGAGAAAGGASASGRRVEVRDLSLRYGEHRLFEGLSGTLSPSVELEGEGQELRRGAEGWLARLRRPVDLGFLRGTAVLEANCAQICDLHLEVPDLVVEHALLARRPLGPWTMSADLRYGRDDHALSGELQLGEQRIRCAPAHSPRLAAEIAEALCEQLQAGSFPLRLPLQALPQRPALLPLE